MNKSKKVLRILRNVFLGFIVLIIAILITRNLIEKKKEKHRDSLSRIKERGYLVALTDQNTLNYFIYRGEPMGYQLELLESFSRFLGVPLKIVCSKDPSKLYYYLQYHVADLIALNLPVSDEGKEFVEFSNPFGETRLVLVQRKHGANEKTLFIDQNSIRDFPPDTVFVRYDLLSEPFYQKFLKACRHRAIIKKVQGVSQEELIRMVSDGSIPYALCQENMAMVYKRYYLNIDASLVVSPLFPFAWGTDHASDSLLNKINEWITAIKLSKELKRTYLDYFDHQRIVKFFNSEYFSINGQKLSPFDPEIKKYSQWINWDWRLLASLIYEESNFRLGQISTHSASGLMQLMPEIAAKYGADSTSTPGQQIAAGVKYIRYLEKNLPAEITHPRERIHFLLAAYNVGIGRILAAREKAKKFGRDPNTWNGHVDYYLLRKSKKDPYFQADTSSFIPVDYKMEGFVDDIMNRYQHYKNIIPQ